jgi:branched-chain amino acid transport system ATP-binding protein
MADAVLRMKREGIAVLLSEQNFDFAAAVADRAYVIERGEIRYDGSMAALDADPALRAQHLTI